LKPKRRHRASSILISILNSILIPIARALCGDAKIRSVLRRGRANGSSMTGGADQQRVCGNSACSPREDLHARDPMAEIVEVVSS